jgi:hypothetical protein
MSNQTSEGFAYIERQYRDVKERIELQRRVVEQLVPLDCPGCPSAIPPPPAVLLRCHQVPSSPKRLPIVLLPLRAGSPIIDVQHSMISTTRSPALAMLDYLVVGSRERRAEPPSQLDQSQSSTFIALFDPERRQQGARRLGF